MSIRTCGGWARGGLYPPQSSPSHPIFGACQIMSADTDRIEQIYKILHTLSSSQIEAIENIVLQLTKPYTTITRLPSSDIVDNCLLYMFGDSLKIHHCFSKEPLSKDRFEYALERSSQLCGKAAILAPKGNPGHDITINGKAISLKTEASANIKAGRVHISKFMELGKGDWNFVLCPLGDTSHPAVRQMQYAKEGRLSPSASILLESEADMT